MEKEDTKRVLLTQNAGCESRCLNASLAGAVNVGAGTSGHAFVDPVVSIDSSFTSDPNSYAAEQWNWQFVLAGTGHHGIDRVGFAAIIALRRRRALSRIARAPLLHR